MFKTINNTRDALPEKKSMLLHVVTMMKYRTPTNHLITFHKIVVADQYRSLKTTQNDESQGYAFTAILRGVQNSK